MDRPCPCEKCKRAMVTDKTYKVHKAQIDDGSRQNKLKDCDQNDLPGTFYQLKDRARAVAGVGAGCKTFYRHFCDDCGEIFPEDFSVVLCVASGCTGARFNSRGRPRRKALYYDIRDKFTRLLENGFMSEFLLSPLPPVHQGNASKRDLQDVFDGDIINALRSLWPDAHVIYVAMVRLFCRVSVRFHCGMTYYMC